MQSPCCVETVKPVSQEHQMLLETFEIQLKQTKTFMIASLQLGFYFIICRRKLVALSRSTMNIDVVNIS